MQHLVQPLQATETFEPRLIDGDLFPSGFDFERSPSSENHVTRFMKVDFERAALELKNNKKFQKANVTAKSGSVISVVLCD